MAGPERVADGRRPAAALARAGTPRDEVGRRGGGPTRSRPRSRGRRSRPPRAGQPRGGLASRRGTTRIGRRPGGRDDEHRQALQRHRRVAGQVAQVRADADEQGRDPASAASRWAAASRVRVALGRDRGAGGEGRSSWPGIVAVARRRPRGPVAPAASGRRSRARTPRASSAVRDEPVGAGGERPSPQLDIVVLPDGEDARARRRRPPRSPRPRRRRGPSGRRSPASTPRRSTASQGRPASRAATGSAPVGRTSAASRVAQMRSSARIAIAGRRPRSADDLPRSGGRRRAPSRCPSAGRHVDERDVAEAADGHLVDRDRHRVVARAGRPGRGS